MLNASSLMHLDSLRLINFRIYDKFETNFSDGLNIITGDNGIGKSSILEAIHYLSLTKSFRSNKDEESIKFDSENFLTSGIFISDKGIDENISISYSKKSGKIIKNQGKRIPNSGDIVGRHPIVLLSPEDVLNTLGAPSGHRKFLNLSISQVKNRHLNNLISYNSVLKQRNSAITYAASGSESFEKTLDVVEEQIGEICYSIVTDREKFIIEISDEFEMIFSKLNNGKKIGSIEYLPSITGNREEMVSILKERRATDFNAGYTTKGPHRDRLLFKINDKSLKNFGSKGENKIFLVALKIAQGNYIQRNRGIRPIYLLDDIFMELDRRRAVEIVKHIENVGQVIITTTDFNEWSDMVQQDVNVIGLT